MNTINLELTTDILTDSNHYMRRFFRCWIDGSYTGESHYRQNCRFARAHYDDDKALRTMVISEWLLYMAQENDCSTSTVRRHMVDYFSRDQLEALNAELIDDFRDLVRWEMEEEA